MEQARQTRKMIDLLERVERSLRQTSNEYIADGQNGRARALRIMGQEIQELVRTLRKKPPDDVAVVCTLSEIEA